MFFEVQLNWLLYHYNYTSKLQKIQLVGPDLEVVSPFLRWHTLQLMFQQVWKALVASEVWSGCDTVVNMCSSLTFCIATYHLEEEESFRVSLKYTYKDISFVGSFSLFTLHPWVMYPNVSRSVGSVNLH